MQRRDFFKLGAAAAFVGSIPASVKALAGKVYVFRSKTGPQSIILPPAQPGQTITIANHGTFGVRVYPAAGVKIAARKSVVLTKGTDGTWRA